MEKTRVPYGLGQMQLFFQDLNFSQASHCLKRTEKMETVIFWVLLCLNRLDGYASDYSKKMHDMSSFSFQCRRALRKTLIAKAAAPIPCSSNGPSPSEKKGTGSFVGTG